MEDTAREKAVPGIIRDWEKDRYYFFKGLGLGAWQSGQDKAPFFPNHSGLKILEKRVSIKAASLPCREGRH